MIRAPSTLCDLLRKGVCGPDARYLAAEDSGGRLTLWGARYPLSVPYRGTRAP